MAERVLIEEKSLEELEREIICGICQEHYTEPKILPCLHYYCKQCVLRIALRTDTGKPFSCPECRCETTLPEGGVDNLKTAFFVNRLKTTVSTMERAYGKVEVKCELCSNSEGKAEAFCRQCAMFICKNCIQQHKSLKILLSHEVAALEDLKEGRAKPIIVREPPSKLCPKHEEPLIVYCFKCESLICQHCTVKDHRDHDFEFCKVAAPTIKKNLLEKLDPLKNQKEGLTQAIIKIQQTRQEITAQGEDVANSIRKSFKELQNILDKREQQLLQETTGIVRKKVDKLSAQEKNLSVASADVQSVVDYTEQCVSHCTDNEVMSMYSEIKRQIEKKVEHSKSEKSLEPAEEADMGIELSCAKALQHLCQTQANIIELPVDPANCTVTMEEDNKQEVNKVCTAILLTRLTNNKISRKSSKVSCSLKSLYNNVITACKVEEAGAGQYSIQYTPSVRGRHELTVSVDGQQVAGSPFPVFVSIHPTQLGKPVKIWKDLNNPTGITVNSIGEILVCECYTRNIIKFDKDGKRKTLTNQERVTRLHKVEVDSMNSIYCISDNSNKVLRCDQDGGHRQLQVIKQDETGCQGLAVVGEEVMVCGSYNSGTIMILDKELNLKRCIRHDEGNITAISADHHGNLYCTVCGNDCVHVFGTDDVFLRSFGCDEKGEKKVKNPWGLCVSGHYVYVCNVGFHNVSVFTTDGEYVISFGRHGSEEGQFKFPHSVCVDKDGFVYVTELNNQRIQCF